MTKTWLLGLSLLALGVVALGAGLSARDAGQRADDLALRVTAVERRIEQLQEVRRPAAPTPGDGRVEALERRVVELELRARQRAGAPIAEAAPLPFDLIEEAGSEDLEVDPQGRRRLEGDETPPSPPVPTRSRLERARRIDKNIRALVDTGSLQEERAEALRDLLEREADVIEGMLAEVASGADPTQVRLRAEALMTETDHAAEDLLDTDQIRAFQKMRRSELRRLLTDVGGVLQRR